MAGKTHTAALLPGLCRTSSRSVPRLIWFFLCCPPLAGFRGGLVAAGTITRSRLSLELHGLSRVRCHSRPILAQQKRARSVLAGSRGLKETQKYRVPDQFRLGFNIQISFRIELRFEAEVKPRLGTRLQQHPSFITCSWKVTSINPPVSTQPCARELPKREMPEVRSWRSPGPAYGPTASSCLQTQPSSPVLHGCTQSPVRPAVLALAAVPKSLRLEHKRRFAARSRKAIFSQAADFLPSSRSPAPEPAESPSSPCLLPPPSQAKRVCVGGVRGVRVHFVFQNFKLIPNTPHPHPPPRYRSQFHPGQGGEADPAALRSPHPTTSPPADEI